MNPYATAPLPYPNVWQRISTKVKVALLAAILVVIVIVIIAVATSGSSKDTEFIRRLDSANIHYNSESKAIKGAHAVCDYLDKGYSVDQATAGAMEVVTDPWDAGYIVGASIGVYCPKYGAQIG